MNINQTAILFTGNLEKYGHSTVIMDPSWQIKD
jgi:hypothetical protein